MPTWSNGLSREENIIGWQGKRIAELEAQLAAIKEAVKWERECEDVAHWRYEVWVMAEVGSGDCEIYTVAQCIHHAARAEVDRILSEEK